MSIAPTRRLAGFPGRAARPLVLCVLAAVLETAVAAAQCPDGAPPPCAAAVRAAARRTPPAPSVRARHFLVMPFRNVSRAEAQDWLVDGAQLMLTDALSQFRDIAVIPPEQLLAARRRLGLTGDAAADAAQLRRLAEETGGWTTVNGTVLASGGRLHLAAQALDAVSGAVLVRAEADIAADADVRPAFDRLSLRLLEVAGLPPQTSDVAALTTRSLDAYRAYVRGTALLGQSAFTSAREAFREAVRLDSTFALAWARLALTGAAWNVAELANPLSASYAATLRASALASRLPPRQAALVRAQSMFFAGRLAATRAVADSLARADAGEIEARELLALLEMVDPVLDSTRTPPRPRGDYNRTRRYALEVLERDPGRRYAYGVLGFVYGVAAGWWGGPFGSTAREQPSFAATVMAPSAGQFTAVLRDSFEVLTAPAFDSLPGAEQRRLRRHAAEVGIQWMQRWLAAGPGDGDAHLWMSRLVALTGDTATALAETDTALALGVESPLEFVPGRRVVLLLGAGRVSEAAALADSLLAAGAWRRPVLPNLDHGWSFGVAALLLARRFDRAVELAAIGLVPPPGEPRCAQLAEFLDPVRLHALPPGLARAAADTAFTHAAPDPALAGCTDALRRAAGR